MTGKTPLTKSSSRLGPWGLAIVALTGLGALGLGAPPAQAAPAGRSEKGVIELEVGSSQLVRPTGVPERVLVGEPNVCDVVSVGGGGLILTAKAAGETPVTISLRDGSQSVFRVISSMPTTALSQALSRAFPQEEDLQARSVGGVVYLAGTVSDAQVVEAAGRLAQSLFVGSGRKVGEIVNLLQVATLQQVQVHLRFVEISRTNMRNMGFNAWYNSDSTAAGMLGPNAPLHYSITNDISRFAGPANPMPAPGGIAAPGQPNANPWLPMLVSPVTGSFALSLATTGFLPGFPLSATLGLLEQRGVAKTLSEPTLVAISGKQAKFLVGGEFPVPIPSALGQTSVQFKPYGAQLIFTPVVIGQETINLEVQSDTSDLDRANGTSIANFVVPAVVSRQSQTTVRLRDGQTFAIAGLLSDKISQKQSNVPGLGDIPLIGAFFRNTENSRQESELMVMVTVNLVKPMEPNQVQSSINQNEFTEPGSLELFIMGHYEKTAHHLRDKSKEAPAKRGPAHAMNEPDGLVGFSR